MPATIYRVTVDRFTGKRRKQYLRRIVGNAYLWHHDQALAMPIENEKAALLIGNIRISSRVRTSHCSRHRGGALPAGEYGVGKPKPC